MVDTRRLRISPIAVLIAASVLLCSCSSQPIPVSQTRAELLGTVITITSYETIAPELYEECFELVRAIDGKLSAHDPLSEISALNSSGAGRVSDETYEVLSMAAEYSALTCGAFDVSIGAVMDLWKDGELFCVLPSQVQIEEVLSLVDYNRIILSMNNQVYLERGMKLDLGAIAKGWACDRIAELLSSRGVRDAVLDFGGNICAMGKKPDASAWRVGIRNPEIGSDGYFCVVEASDMCVVTSGGYERYFERDGELYHHILDPWNGYPADTSLMSVTIISNDGAQADALSTACFVLGLEEGLALLESSTDCEGIFVTSSREVYTTGGLSARVEITDDRYTLSENER